VKPSDKEKRRIDAKFEKLKKGEILSVKNLPTDASTADTIKYQLCQKVCWLKNEKRLEYEALAKAMGCDVIRAKQMAHSHYDAFTLEELVNYFDKLLASDLAKDVGSHLVLLPKAG
jgi:hypothetical protein